MREAPEGALRFNSRDLYKLFGVLHRKGLQNDSVGKTEYRGVRTNAKRKCENSDRSEPWIPAEHADAVTNILRKIPNPTQTPCLTRGFPHQADIPDFTARGIVGLPRCFSPLNTLALRNSQMALDFILQILFAS